MFSIFKTGYRVLAHRFAGVRVCNTSPDYAIRNPTSKNLRLLMPGIHCCCRLRDAKNNVVFLEVTHDVNKALTQLQDSHIELDADAHGDQLYAEQTDVLYEYG